MLQAAVKQKSSTLADEQKLAFNDYTSAKTAFDQVNASSTSVETSLKASVTAYKAAKKELKDAKSKVAETG